MNKDAENNLHNQIKDTFHKAWRDALEAKVREEPPDYEWIVRLYAEIRHKLTFFLKKGSTFRNEIEESLDVQLFEQMIRNEAFKGPEFYKLVSYVFDTCLKLGSPGRDNDVKAKKEEVLESLKSGAVFAVLVPLFFKNANITVDWVLQDLQNVSKNIKDFISSNV